MANKLTIEKIVRSKVVFLKDTLYKPLANLNNS